MAPTVIRDLGYGVYFVGYEFLCKELTKYTKDEKRSIPVCVVAGGLTGIVSWAIVFPVDVIKTRLQMDGLHGSTQYRGIIDAFRKSVAQDGWVVLTKGLGATVVRAFPCNAVMFPVMEICLLMMK